MTAAHADDTPSRLVLSPFRGLRFTPEADRAAVISPPYDMIDPDRAQALASGDAHNIVRVILPEFDEPDSRLRYRRAARTLRDWRAEGLLALDREPALYVYEQVTEAGETDAGTADATPVVQRGLIGAVRLPPEGEPSASARIHPHEDVVGAVVQDRRSLMYALGANPEPILLTYRGGGAASDLVERVADSGGNAGSAGNARSVGSGADSDGAESEAAGEAAGDSAGDAAGGAAAKAAEAAQSAAPLLIDVRTADGIRHRLWAVTNAADIEAVAEDLADREALIADGHHRYAAYRELARLGRPGSEYGLALLVDSERHPLRVRGIHRWLPDLPVGHALHEAEKWFTVRPVEGGYRGALEALGELPAERIGFAVVDGHKAWLLTDPDERLLAQHVPADRPEAWRRLDATVLHHALAGAVWSVPDTAEHIRYDHDPRSAVAEAYRHSGIAVLLRPVAESTVLELAAAGCMMPRKSTSFSPKPATGLVLRVLDEAEES